MADNDSAQARVNRYTRDQQGLRDWSNDTIKSHAAAIALALEFDEGKKDRLPSDPELVEELNLAAKKFDRSPQKMWRVLKTHYQQSDAILDVWATQFVVNYDNRLRRIADQRQLGDIDDEEANPDDTDNRPFKIIADEAIKEATKELQRSETDIKKSLQRAIRAHPGIGATSVDPPGAHDGMRQYGRFRTTKYGVFAPGGMFGWERICKTPLDPLAHSSMFRTDMDPRVHLIATTYEGAREIKREIEIPRIHISLKSHGTAVKALTHFNIYCVRSEDARAEMVDFLNWRPTKLKIVRTKTTGWVKTDSGYCFVQPLAPPDLEPLMPKASTALVPKNFRLTVPRILVRLDTSIGAAGQSYGFHVAGTVREWQNEVASPLQGCSNVTLAVGVALAAPMLPFAGEQTGGFHIYSNSTLGKTAAGAVGESFYGRPSTTRTRDGEAFGSKWATASDVGIVALAQRRTCLPLFLDEIGSAMSVTEKLVETIYVLTGGTAKLRADSQGNVRPQVGFSTLVFSTGEPPLRTFLDKMDDTLGRMKRLADLPAMVGVDTALETVPHYKLGDVCGRIYAATDRLHGAIGQAWLRHLVNLGETQIKAKFEQHRATWLALPDIAELLHRDPRDDSVIRRFALVAASLRMAVEAELWPWSIEESDRGIVACTLRWAADKGLPVVTLEGKAAEQKLRAAIEAERAKFVILEKHPGRGGGLFIPIPEHAVVYENPAAFRDAGSLYGFIKIDGENTRILIDRDAFHRLSAGCDLGALVAHLQRNGLLEIKNEKIHGRTAQYYVLTDGFLRGEHSTER
jgi:hypothetical protein